MTILYTNGDFHTMAAQASNQYITASDDVKYEYIRGLPHPDNLAVSWSVLLSKLLKSSLHFKAELGNTITSIINTTREWADKHKNNQPLIIIQWDLPIDSEQVHEEIWKLHQILNIKKIDHIFFNSNNSFNNITKQYDWGDSYVLPYVKEGTYINLINSAGIETIMPNSIYFGKNGHLWWSNYLLNYLLTHNFIK